MYPYKIVEGSCVDTFSNKDVCQTKSGETKSTLTGQCGHGDSPVRCCPKHEWPTFSVTTNCDVADDKKQDTQTNTIRELNLKIQKDDRINYSLLPLSDGLSFIQKK